MKVTVADLPTSWFKCPDCLAGLRATDKALESGLATGTQQQLAQCGGVSPSIHSRSTHVATDASTHRTMEPQVFCIVVAEGGWQERVCLHDLSFAQQHLLFVVYGLCCDFTYLIIFTVCADPGCWDNQGSTVCVYLHCICHGIRSKWRERHWN